MLRINDKFSLSYLNGYYQTHEHMISKEGVHYTKEAKTYAKEDTCTKALLSEGVLLSELEGAYKQAELLAGINSAKLATIAKQRNFKKGE